MWNYVTIIGAFTSFLKNPDLFFQLFGTILTC
jgi:hypothetical protein